MRVLVCVNSNQATLLQSVMESLADAGHEGVTVSGPGPSAVKVAALVSGVEAVVVLVAGDTRAAGWIGNAMDAARAEDKRLIGIWGDGAVDGDAPAGFARYGDALICWDSATFVDVLEKGRVMFQDADCGARPNITIRHK